MKHVIGKLIFTLGLFCLLSPAHAEAGGSGGVKNLSPEIRALLQKEMRAIDAAMSEIIKANAEGDMKKISKVAKQIKDSFILNQGLSRSQKHELHTTLSADFLKMDEAFHYNAGMLEHVAENQKTELIGFYYSKLFEACSSCHAQHAKHKFPSFTKMIKREQHKH